MRHFVVNPTISDQGEHIGGVVGFLKGLAHLSSRIMPSRIIVVWEAGGSPRRRAIYGDYKQGRRPQRLNRYYGDEIPDTVENRNNQISNIIDILYDTPVDQFYIPDCEADDIIAYLVKYRIEDRAVIASSDKDLYQLLSKKVIQWSPGQKKFITLKDVKEKFGISVENFCTARAFVGDSSDGLSGVPTVGFASLLKRFPELSSDEFVSVEKIVDLSREYSANSKLKIFKNIVTHCEAAKRNWKLMYLDIKNLSAFQVKKVNEVFENPNIRCDKFKTLKKFSKLGINNFDIDSFFSSISAARKNR